MTNTREDIESAADSLRFAEIVVEDGTLSIEHDIFCPITIQPAETASILAEANALAAQHPDASPDDCLRAALLDTVKAEWGNDLPEWRPGDLLLKGADFCASDEHDLQPVWVLLRDIDLDTARKALEILRANRFLSRVAIDEKFFDWHTNESYEGKARAASLSFAGYGLQTGELAWDAHFIFFNEWSGTRYTIDVTGALHDLLAPSLAQAA